MIVLCEFVHVGDSEKFLFDRLQVRFFFHIHLKNGNMNTKKINLLRLSWQPSSLKPYDNWVLVEKMSGQMGKVIKNDHGSQQKRSKEP